jgi:hypothetical protein
MANKIFFFLTLPLPALLAFLCLKFTLDAIITLLVVTLIGFVIPIWVYDKFVGDFSYERKIPEEIVNKSEKISLGTKLLGGAAICLALIHILYSMYAPASMGPETVVLPFPIFDGAFGKTSYWIIFVALFILANIFEHIFFNYFVPIEYTEKEGKLALLSGENVGVVDKIVISFFVALYYFVIFYYTISRGIVPPLVYAILGFGLNFFALGLRVDKKLIVSTMFKIGVAVGILLYIFWLNMSSKKGWTRKSPDFFFVGNFNNVFNKWTHPTPL